MTLLKQTMIKYEYIRIHSLEVDSWHLVVDHCTPWADMLRLSDQWVVETTVGQGEVQDYKQDFRLEVQGTADGQWEAPDNLYSPLVVLGTVSCLLEVQGNSFHHLPEDHNPHWVVHLSEPVEQMLTHQFQLPHYHPPDREVM